MDFTVVVLEGAYAAAVAATVDILAAAQAMQRAAGLPVLRVEVGAVGGGGAATRLSSGLSIATAPLRVGAGNAGSVWIVPGLGLETAAALDARLARPDAQKAAKAIARHVARGGRVAAACSAVFLLHRAGVLDGRRATTTWWLGRLLAERAPRCAVDTHAMVCADGPVITAGAAFAQTDLMMHLLRERSGTRLVDRLARLLLLDGRQAQAKYVVPELLANGDALIGEITARIEARLPEAPSVAELAASFGMSERTLSRQVRRATGQSTLALLHSVKARRAQTLLRSSRMSVEDIASHVGYQDASTLRRLLKKVGGGSPLAYRGAR